MTIRDPLQTKEELEILIRMLRDFHAVSIYADRVPFDTQSMVDSLINLVNGGGRLHVITHDDAIIGLIGVVYTTAYFNKNVNMGVEMYWWVDPEHRNKVSARETLKYVIDECRKDGMQQFSAMKLASSPDGVDNLYESMGFSYMESAYMLGLT